MTFFTTKPSRMVVLPVIRQATQRSSRSNSLKRCQKGRHYLSPAGAIKKAWGCRRCHLRIRSVYISEGLIWLVLASSQPSVTRDAKLLVILENEIQKRTLILFSPLPESVLGIVFLPLYIEIVGCIGIPTISQGRCRRDRDVRLLPVT